MWTFARDAGSDLWRPYRVYAGLAAATIAISLVLDLRDIAEWIGGARGSILTG